MAYLFSIADIAEINIKQTILLNISRYKIVHSLIETFSTSRLINWHLIPTLLKHSINIEIPTTLEPVKKHSKLCAQYFDCVRDPIHCSCLLIRFTNWHNLVQQQKIYNYDMIETASPAFVKCLLALFLVNCMLYQFY